MTLKEWQFAASLQASVYAPFVNWLRSNKGMTDMQILRCMDLDHYEVEYWETHIRQKPPGETCGLYEGY